MNTTKPRPFDDRRRATPATRAILAAVLCLHALAASAAERLPLRERLVFSGDHPRAIFFRGMERRPGTYDAWENDFDDLMGFIGQALPDQRSDHINGIPPAIAERYARFKERHPDQVVLLHVNGMSQVPMQRTMDDTPGHWLYFEGARIMDDIPADAGPTTFRVANVKRFTMQAGFERNRPDHIGLCRLDDNGRPDWHRAEYVRLTAIDRDAGAITVARAQFGSTARALPRGQGFAAALVTHGPWNREQGELEWQYNFSTACPRDAQGRNAADMYVDYLANALGEGGPLQALDGVAFDVMYLVPQILGGQWRFRQPDFDADGKGDNAHEDTTYMAGMNAFYRQLHRRLGPEYILTSDVQELDNQRAIGILNGGESENWLSSSDPLTRHWSSGMNRNRFWKQHARQPTFNYLNHKFFPTTIPPRRKGKMAFQSIPFNQHRLKMAAAVLTGAVITNNRHATHRFGIWDELVCGRDRTRGWLGRAIGPMVRTARDTSPLIEGQPISGAALLPRLRGDGIRFTPDGEWVRIEAVDQKDLRFELTGIPVRGTALTLFATMRAAPREGFPPEHARVLFASAEVKGVPHPRLRRHHMKQDHREFAFLNASEFTAGFQFLNLAGDSVDVEFCLEASEPMWLKGLEAYTAPDAVYREFTHGVVLANPGAQPHTFHLARTLPGRVFRRIAGTSLQDPETNNGQVVGDTVTLPPRDALFLVRTDGKPSTIKEAP